MKDWEEQEQRIIAVVGEADIARRKGFKLWHQHLTSSLSLPFEVTGVEDFRWEEFYVFGPGSKREYQRLRQNQPSYRDVFDLVAIRMYSFSEWCLVPDELKAHVRRKTDGRQFVLGLSELKTTIKGSKNYQLLRDYAVWLFDY